MTAGRSRALQRRSAGNAGRALEGHPHPAGMQGGGPPDANTQQLPQGVWSRSSRLLLSLPDGPIRQQPDRGSGPPLCTCAPAFPAGQSAPAGRSPCRPDLIPFPPRKTGSRDTASGSPASPRGLHGTHQGSLDRKHDPVSAVSYTPAPGASGRPRHILPCLHQSSQILIGRLFFRRLHPGAACLKRDQIFSVHPFDPQKHRAVV